MNGPRFFCADLSPDTLALDHESSRHALGSLRLRAGDRVELFDGQGNSAEADLIATESSGKRRLATVRLLARQKTPKPTRSLTLFVAGAKGPRLTTLVEKCTELGVSALYFTDWQHCVVHVGENGLAKLKKTAIEACKQCGRNWLPELAAGQSIDDFLASEGQQLIAHPSPESQPVSNVLNHTTPTLLAIGPEGGFTNDEVAKMRAAGALPVLLGAHILRVETAALAMTAIWGHALH